ncbi:DNA-binding transcriptional LysR family regulator [Ensifer sp. 4252]
MIWSYGSIPFNVRDAQSASAAPKESIVSIRYPATIGLLPVFLARIGRKYPDIELHISSGSTNDIIRGLENGQINLGFIRPVENIGSLRFYSIAHERYLLAVEKNSALLARGEIGIEDLKGEKTISFSRQNLSFTKRYFTEKFEEHDLSKNVAYTCDDTFSLVSLVSAGLGIGFAPEWTLDLPNRNFELRKVQGVSTSGSDLGSPGVRMTQPPPETTSSISLGRWSGRAGESACARRLGAGGRSCCDPSVKRSGLPGLGFPDPGRLPSRDADPPRRGF